MKIIKKISACLVILGWLLAHTGAVFAATYYVDGASLGGACSDVAAGTALSTPWCTVTKAATTATAGDTVNIRAATYRETATIANSGSGGSPIIFQSYNSEEPIIKGSDAVTGWTSLGDEESGGLFVSGFEEQPIITTANSGAFDSVTVSGSNTLTAQSSVVNNGGYALQTNYVSGLAADENVRVNKTITSSNDVYARFYFKLNSGFDLNAASTLHDILRLRLGTSANRLKASIAKNGSNQFYLDVRTETPSATVIYAGTPGELVPGAAGWYRVEVRYKGGDASTGGAQVWLNGVSVGSNYTMNTSTLQVSRVELGGNSSGATSATAGSIIYYDDFKVDTAAVGVFSAGDPNIYRSAVSWTARQVFQNGTRLTEAGSLAAVNSAGKWYVDTVADLLYVWTSDSSDPDTKTMEVSRRNSMLELTGKNYITLNDLTLAHGNNSSFGAVHLINSDNASIEDNTIYDNFGSGVFLDSSTDGVISDNTFTGNMRMFGGAVRLQNGSNTNTISNNSITGIDGAGGNGIFLCGDGTCSNVGNDTNTISGNTISHVHDSCIYLDTDNDDNIIEKNTCSYAVRNTSDSTSGGNGIHVALGSDTNMIRNNIVHNVERHGISIRSATGVSNSVGNKIYNNTVYNVGTTSGSGIDVQDSSYLTVVKNNISHSAATSPISIDPDADFSAPPGNEAESDYNIFYNTLSSTQARWNDTSYTSFAAYQAASGQDANSTYADPLFTNAGSADFTLQATSTAIEAGTTLADVLTDFLNVSRPQGGAYDLGAYEVVNGIVASSNYLLHDFGMGGGGETTSTSTLYGLNALLGELADMQLEGTLYSLGPGVIFTRQANTPAAPTLSNPSSYYDKLLLVIDNGDNPSDATFAVAISNDDFVTTQYVQSDLSIGSTLDITDYQTYADWGGGSGVTIHGLLSNSTYKVKVKAMHGAFTETGYSVTASADTLLPSMTYDLDVSATDSESSPPYSIAFGQLTPGSVTTATEKIWVDITTNGNYGALVAIRGDQAGLYSANANYTITSATANLSSVGEGFGVQVATVGQSAGGPLAAVSPYNGAAENVGIVDLTYRNILESAAEITAGRASIFVKTKASAVTPAATDYADTLTVVAAGKF